MGDGTLAEARALLRSFTWTDLRALRVRTGAIDMWLARDTGLRHAETAPPIAGPEGFVAADVPAPHLGTVAWLADEGAQLAPGEVLARIAVLDEEREVLADAGGTVLAHRCTPGDLIEYGEALVALS